jgi:thiol:disulfide interchange protein DsbD
MAMWIERLLPLALLWLVSTSADAAPVRDRHVEAELIAEPVSIQPGRPFWVGLRLKHDVHWHTYWRNPGDSGLATQLRWSLPDGFSAGDIQWPYPDLIPTPPLATFGYEGEVVLLVQITPPASLSESAYKLRARADWLMCKEECIPGRAELELLVEPGQDSSPRADHAPLFEAARRRLPSVSKEWSFDARRDGADLLLMFRGPHHLDSVFFFPYEENVVEHAAAQQLERVGEAWSLRIQRPANAEGWPDRITGVAVASPGWSGDSTHRAVPIDLPLSGDPHKIPAAGSLQIRTPLSLVTAMLLAFVGGVILNLMPCVFPVISIKVLGFVEQARDSRQRVMMHGLVFAAGVLVCFWLLAGTLIALRSGGAEIGWGFQLQSPRVVMALAALFFALGLSLFGVAEFGLSLTRAGQQLQARSGYLGSFFSGLLATIVATPCTAPFMGVALGYALAQPPAAALSIFTALGAGMAAPYLLLSMLPGLIRRIPRPGPWMESLKQAMGFLLMGTVVWLLWVLSRQVGDAALIQMAILFLALGLALWIAGRWGALHRPLKTRIHARILAWAIAIAALVGTLGPGPVRARGDEEAVTPGNLGWERFTPERVAELRAARNPVFIDFTAAWCLTCQVNKRVALRRPEVEARFRELGVATLQADWTDRDETITRALAEFGRSGVPLYVLYPADPSAPPRLLPELLTPGIVLDALAGIDKIAE